MKDKPNFGALQGDVASLSNNLVGLEEDVNDLGGRIGALSNNFVGLKGDVQTLSNTLASDYNTTRDLHDELMATYAQKYEIENILDLIDEATSDPYVLPNDISLSNLIVEKIKGIGFPEYV